MRRLKREDNVGRWREKEEIQGAERDKRAKDRDPVAIQMSVCAEADAHLPSTHTCSSPTSKYIRGTSPQTQIVEVPKD